MISNKKLYIPVPQICKSRYLVNLCLVSKSDKFNKAIDKSDKSNNGFVS